MKFTIEQGDMAKALAGVIGVIDRKNTFPILSNVMICADNGEITIKGSDLDIEVTTHTAADITETGSTTVSAGLLSDIVKKLPKGKLIEIDLDDHLLRVSSGRSRFNLATLPVEDFPSMASDDYDTTAVIDAALIADIFGKTRFAMSSEETRYYLQGVYLHNDDEGHLVAVSTDGHRLARYQVEDGPEVSGVIVPAKTVGEIIKLASIGGYITLKTSATKVQFSGDWFTLTSKVIDSTFPDYTRVIPQGNDKSMKVGAKVFSAASNLVATVSDDRVRAVKVALDTDQCKLSVSGSNSDAVDVIEVEYSGEPFNIAFNSKYMAEMMAQAEGGDVTVKFGGYGDPALVTMSEVPEFTGVVMPMRV